MRYRAIIVVVLAIVAVAGIVATLTLSRTTPRRRGGSSSPTTTAPAPPSTTSALTSTTSAPTTTIAGPPTTIGTFDPWLAPGKLTPSFRVSSVKTGECTTPPVTQDSGNPSAWRCTTATGHGFLNIPCFAPKGASDVTEVACLDLPTTGATATLVRLSRHLVEGTRTTTPPGQVLWTFYLSNGERCQDIWGTHTRFGAVELPYACDGGKGGYTSAPDTSVEPWTVTFLTAANCTGERCSGPPETVAVTKVWL